jgi:hypothetical protein
VNVEIEEPPACGVACSTKRHAVHLPRHIHVLNLHAFDLARHEHQLILAALSWAAVVRAWDQGAWQAEVTRSSAHRHLLRFILSSMSYRSSGPSGAGSRPVGWPLIPRATDRLGRGLDLEGQRATSQRGRRHFASSVTVRCGASRQTLASDSASRSMVRCSQTRPGDTCRRVRCSAAPSTPVAHSRRSRRAGARP